MELGTPELIHATKRVRERKIFRRFWLAAGVILAMVLTFVIFSIAGWTKDTAVRYMTGVFQSIIVAILVSLFRSISNPVSEIFSETQREELSKDMSERIIKSIPRSSNVKIHDNWYKIEWGKVLGNPRSLDVIVPFFDTWFQLGGGDVVEGVLSRGGSVRFVVTKDSKAEREFERFPDHVDAQGCARKLRGTILNVKKIREEMDRDSGNLEIYTTEKYMMFSLIRVDNSQVFICLYDHFRSSEGARNRKAPTFEVNMRTDDPIWRWADDEVKTFVNGSSIAWKD